MRPISKYNGAFYGTYVDICGPFKAYSMHQKRELSTINVWLIVYCCMSTSTTSAKVMDDYCTQHSFIQSFITFSCKFGYPKFMLIDKGSQLVKGCQAMQLRFKDIKRKLHKDI